MKHWSSFAVLAAVVAGAASTAAQSAHDPGSRQIWDEEFVKARPRPARAKTAAPPRADSAAAGPAFVGVTLWRLSPAPEGSRAVTVEGEGKRWLPARSEVDTAIPEGQQVRLAVEASRPGYLYVIDRERYADGTTGQPTLIFPTGRIHGGDNAVKAGRLVEIPDLGDKPPYFTLRRSRPDHTQEELLLLVAPEPIAGLSVAGDAQPLSRETVADWEKRWGARHAKLEAKGGAGAAYTAAERSAASSPQRLLTRGEPLPQTLYRLQGAAGDPALVIVTLNIAPR